MKRNIISVIVGLVSAMVVFFIVETINSSLHPIAQTFDYKDSIAGKAFHKHQPLTLWLFVLAGWIIGSALCGFIIKLVSKNENKKLPITAGSILTFSAIANFFFLPHPAWFIIVGLLIFIPSTLLGHNSYKLKSNG
ncbi:hypothetical protein ACFSPU_12530 [Haoranjiania flava]|uniref:Uncharacterized protein n=1 Tax=Haoranjiania flava TaxID=1856322 RepID=A0AAE3IQV3_9BACT|nr:hypothetical protein [Haoranjiania flava]MCU7695496.1 hypothetical protein [Haoranjiania flava]